MDGSLADRASKRTFQQTINGRMERIDEIAGFGGKWLAGDKKAGNLDDGRQKMRLQRGSVSQRALPALL